MIKFTTPVGLIAESNSESLEISSKKLVKGISLKVLAFPFTMITPSAVLSS